jgi:BirA family biotin operon repressor/biotin-[acetyl-CoA-carboxylase] ligase
MSVKALLAQLSDSQFYDVDQLRTALAISASELDILLLEVKQLGIELESDNDQRWRLVYGINLLNENAIRAALAAPTAELITSMAVLDITDSTNLQAMVAAKQGNTGFVCTAEQQTAGRGRRGRNWASPYASNIYLSVVWEFASGVSALEGLSLAVGVAVADALAVAGIEGVTLKWPNDILHDNKKLGGILVEVSGNMTSSCHVVVGIGINVNMPAAAASAIDQPWVDAQSILGESVERNMLLGQFLNELMPLLANYDKNGFATYRDRWQALDAFAGQPVNILYGQERIGGIARGVDKIGALLLETETGTRPFNGGEVSLRGAEQ